MKQTMNLICGIAVQNTFSGGNGLPFENARVVRPNNVVTNEPFGENKRNNWRIHYRVSPFGG